MTARVINVEIPSHGACKLALPWFRSSPNEAEPGGSPSPRKSSAVRLVMEPLKIKGKNVMVATIAFGKMCLNIILVLETPRARAART